MGVVVVLGSSLPAQAAPLVPSCRGTQENEAQCRENCRQSCYGSGVSREVGDACMNSCVKSAQCSQAGEDNCTVDHLLILIGNIFNLLISIAGLMAMLLIIWAGLKYIMAGVIVFNPDERQASAIESAKITLYRAIIGLVIILIAYLVVNTLIVVFTDSAGSVDTFLNPIT